MSPTAAFVLGLISHEFGVNFFHTSVATMFFVKLNMRKKEQKRYELTLEKLPDIANFHQPTLTRDYYGYHEIHSILILRVSA